MPRFEAGNNRNPAGRPKGSKDKKQFSLNYWFNLIQSDYGKLKPSQRVKIALECWKTLINKSKALPVDPEDSNFNAVEAMKMLNEITSGNKPDLNNP
jgi:hypothetical protein